MAAYFLESSAAVKLYVAELGSQWLESLFAPSIDNEFFVAGITSVEVAAALYRRVRSGLLPQAMANAAVDELERDLQRTFAVVDPSRAILTQAISVARERGLRGYDCVQLASALYINVERLRHNLDEIILVSADIELNAAAAQEGLIVEDPNVRGR